MVCNQIPNSALEVQADKGKVAGSRLELSANGLEAPAGVSVQTQRQKKKGSTKKPVPAKEPIVPAYTLEKGRSYDVSGTHTSVKSAEYTGYETIGRLVLYCFINGEQPYKFSELAVLQGGTIRDSRTGEKVRPADMGAKKKPSRPRRG